MSLLDLMRSTSFLGNMYLLNQEDAFDTREDYDGFGLVGSDQSAWIYQQIIIPALLALGEPFEVPSWASTFIRGRGAGLTTTQPAPAPAPAAAPAPPPTLPPTLPSASPPAAAALPAPPPASPATDPFTVFRPSASASASSHFTLFAPSALPKGEFKSKFGADLATNINIGSGSIR